MTDWESAAVIIAGSLPAIHVAGLVQYGIQRRNESLRPPPWAWLYFWAIFASCLSWLLLTLPFQVAAGRLRRLTPAGVAVVITSLVALALRMFLFTRPGALNGVVEYDDGPYVSSAILLVHGVVPYRDYLFVQPPGISLIMAPLALTEKAAWVSVPGVMAAGRVLTAAASASGVLLAGLLVRHRGVVAVAAAAGGLAVYTGSVQAAHTVLLEPWLVLFSLAGAVMLFDGNRVTSSRRRLIASGIAFGFAGATESWAITPVAVIVLVLIPRWRDLARFVTGVLAGGSPLLVFAALAPARFWAGVVTAQVGPRPNAIRMTALSRIRILEGMAQVGRWSALATVALALVLAALVIVPLIGVYAIESRLPSRLETFVLAVLALTTVLFFRPPQFLYHFAGWEGPWLAMAIGLSFSALARAAAGLIPELSPCWPGRFVTAMAAPVLAVFCLAQVAATASAHAAPVFPRVLDRVIPPGACLVSDTSPPLVLLDRLPPSKCPVFLDSIGVTLALSHGLKTDTGAARSRQVQHMWEHLFRKAGYVLFREHALQSPRVAWTPQLRSYFRTHFKLVYEQKVRLGARVPPGWEHSTGFPRVESWYWLYERVPAAQVVTPIR